MSKKKKRIRELEEALEFYADPRTYLGWGFLPDPPVGDLISDFSETEDLGFKPGKRARKLLNWPERIPTEESNGD